MRGILPQMVWTGASIAYWSGLLTPINAKFLRDYNPHYKEFYILQECLLALMFFGIGSACSAIIMGKIIDYSSSKKAIFVNILIMGATAYISIKNIKTAEFGTISHLTCFIWGL